MITLRTGGQVYTIASHKVTHQQFQSAMLLSSLQAQLADVQHLLLTESANGPSRELRRLREKVTRLERRIATAKAAHGVIERA